MEQILKCTPIVQATAYLRDEFVGNVYSKTAALDPSVKNMAEVLFTLKASLAVLSDAPGAAKAQRSQRSWPKAGNLFLKPIGDICGKFFWGWHDVYVAYTHIYCQAKSFYKFLYNNLRVLRHKLIASPKFLG
jgi:hypothetical protein